jgi:hypothetical protein
MHKRAERHAGCRIDVARLRVDPEYASAIRALARFTLDEELRILGALVEFESVGQEAGTAPLAPPQKSESSALVLPFRRPIRA